ncbi:NAD-dependent epimerase/dehydratase family protein [Streptomyces sp. GSL17-111]|uniref:NAD-dependent epimerase/dehydratase family protein n=1 Tax=Streptomyces sp. GSL17-111 TaxID=3121596 RepID=UPI0030F399F4
MRLLVLGGTVFLGHEVAAEAVRRGHDVVCAARGTSGSVPDGATLVRVNRDTDSGLAPLAVERFDAVVDMAPISYPWVRRALQALAGSAGHWTFVSTINVYADTATVGQRADAALVDPVPEQSSRELRDGDLEGSQRYGAIKVAGENAVRETMGERAFVVRPGLIVGPGDPYDPFGYWPARFARGGRVLVPDVPKQPVQYIDVRDLAGWIVDAGERGLAGDYDGVGPAQLLPDLLAEIAAAVGAPVELVPASSERLTEAGVNQWSGRRSLPLWLGPSHHGLGGRDAQPSLDAGLRIRPLADTVASVLAWERERGLDRPRNAGLTLAEEAELLQGI